MSITLELSSLAQAEAIQCALEIYVDMEADRSKHDAADFDDDASKRLLAARQVLASIRGGK